MGGEAQRGDGTGGIPSRPTQRSHQRIVIGSAGRAQSTDDGASGGSPISPPRNRLIGIVGYSYLDQQIGSLVANPPPQVTAFRGCFVEIESAVRGITFAEVHVLRRRRLPVASGEGIRVGGNDDG